MNVEIETLESRFIESDWQNLERLLGCVFPERLAKLIFIRHEKNEIFISF
jgi:hypothetical protein